MKHLHGKAIAALALLGAALFAAGFAETGSDAAKLTTDDPYVVKRYTAEGGVTSVTVEDENVSVRLAASEDDQLIVDYAENEKRFYEFERTDNGALIIRKKKDPRWADCIFKSNAAQQTLTLSLPAGFDGDVTVSNSNGELIARQVALGGLSADTSNQAATLTDVTLSGDLAVDTSNGDITLTRVRAAGAIGARTSNGRVTLTDTLSANVTVGASNTGVWLTGAQADTFVAVDTSNASVQLERLLFGAELRCATSNGSVRGTVAGEQGDFTFSCDTSNGECNLPRSIAGGEKQINLQTSNGDIDVTFVK